jgi:DNA transposition AAA+ family ATPase
MSMTDDVNASHAGEASLKVHKAIVASLERRDPLLVVTGESGTGKTALYRSVIESTERMAFSIILNPFLTFHDLLRQVVADLHVEGDRWTDEDLALAATEHDLIRLIQGFVESNPQRLAVVVIDDAHLLNPVVLSKLRSLLNLSTGDHGLTVVLVGQPALEETLRRPEFQSVAQRVAARHRLGSAAPAPARAREIAARPSASPVAARPSVSSVAVLKRRAATRQLATAVALVLIVGWVLAFSWRWATSTPPDRSVPSAAPRAIEERPPAAPPAVHAPAAASPPVQAPSAAPAPVPQAAAPHPPPTAAAPPPPEAPPTTAPPPPKAPPTTAPPTPKAPPHADDLDAKLNALRQNTERQARVLTSKGNVKALLALRADATRRYQQLGASRPEFLAEVLQALDAKLDEARAIRLRLDADAFRR